MEIRTPKQELKVTGYICDICNKSCNASQDGRYECHEHALLHANWGYHSNNRDGETHECHMCQDCYERVWEFIETLGGKVRVFDEMFFDRDTHLPHFKKEGKDYVVVAECGGVRGESGGNGDLPV